MCLAPTPLLPSPGADPPIAPWRARPPAPPVAARSQLLTHLNRTRVELKAQQRKNEQLDLEIAAISQGGGGESSSRRRSSSADAMSVRMAVAAHGKREELSLRWLGPRESLVPLMHDVSVQADIGQPRGADEQGLQNARMGKVALIALQHARELESVHRELQQRGAPHELAMEARPDYEGGGAVPGAEVGGGGSAPAPPSAPASSAAPASPAKRAAPSASPAAAPASPAALAPSSPPRGTPPASRPPGARSTMPPSSPAAVGRPAAAALAPPARGNPEGGAVRVESQTLLSGLV